MPLRLVLIVTSLLHFCSFTSVIQVIKLSLDPKLGTLKPVVSGLKAKKQPDKETKTEPPINKIVGEILLM